MVDILCVAVTFCRSHLRIQNNMEGIKVVNCQQPPGLIKSNYCWWTTWKNFGQKRTICWILRLSCFPVFGRVSLTPEQEIPTGKMIVCLPPLLDCPTSFPS